MLQDKVVVVAGGAGLLGRSFARCIAEEGGTAVVADIDPVVATQVSEEIGLSFPGRAEPVSLDITDTKSIALLITNLDSRYGHIDAVVNSAYPHNRNYGRKLEDVAYADF